MMRNDRIQRALWNLGLAALLGGFVVIARPAPLAAAEEPQRMHSAACVSELKQYVKRNGLSPSREAQDKALSYCGGGDLGAAIAAIDKKTAGTPSPQEDVAVKGRLSMEENTMRVGKFYGRSAAPQGWRECAIRCERDARCDAYTYARTEAPVPGITVGGQPMVLRAGECLLIDGPPVRRDAPCCISGGDRKLEQR
jgi:hypothetical protein